MEEPSSDPWSLFLYAMKAPATREKYIGRLGIFLNHLGLEGTTVEEKSRRFVEKGRENAGWVFNSILLFMQAQRERADRKEVSAGTIRNYLKAIKLFCEMNDIAVSWKKITRGLPRCRRFAEDRAPTIEEIRQVTEFPDRRIKAVVYTMCSSGMRLEAWEYLRWGHIFPVEREGKVVAARITIYPGDPEEYFSFITPEAYHAVKDWMAYRERAGEKIGKESWVMRDLWAIRKGCISGYISSPKRLRAGGVKRMMEDALWTQGLRKKLPTGKRRHEFQASHGLRKWFKTRCEQAGMKSINIEILMGHSIGIGDSYYRPTEKELLEDYLKVVEGLTINSESRLKGELEGLQRERASAPVNEDVVAVLSDRIMHLTMEVEKLKERSSIG